VLTEEFMNSALNNENIQSSWLIDAFNYIDDLIKNIKVFKIQGLVDSNICTEMLGLINQLKLAVDKLDQIPETKEEPLQKGQMNVKVVSNLMEFILGLLKVNEKEFNYEIRYIKEHKPEETIKINIILNDINTSFQSAYKNGKEFEKKIKNDEDEELLIPLINLFKTRITLQRYEAFLKKYDGLTEEEFDKTINNDNDDDEPNDYSIEDDYDLSISYLGSQNILLNKTSAMIPRKSSMNLESFNKIIETINNVGSITLESLKENIKKFNALLKQINPKEGTGKDTYFDKGEKFYRHKIVEQIKSTQSLKSMRDLPDAKKLKRNNSATKEIIERLGVEFDSEKTIENLDEIILNERVKTYINFNRENYKMKILEPILKKIRTKNKKEVKRYLIKKYNEFKIKLDKLVENMRSVKSRIMKPDNDIIAHEEILIILSELYNLFMTKLQFGNNTYYLNTISGFIIKNLEIDDMSGIMETRTIDTDHILFQLFFDDNQTKVIKMNVKENHNDVWNNITMLELTIIKYLLCFKGDNGHTYYYDKDEPVPTNKTFYLAKLENSAILHSLQEQIMGG
jgi:predicted phosphatase